MSGIKGRSGGWNRVPTVIKRGRGTDRRDRRNPREPSPEIGVPLPPPWLSAEARQHYNRLGAVVLQMRVMTVSDGEALALAASALEDYHTAAEIVRKEGSVLTRSTENGESSYRHPAQLTKELAWRRVRDALRAFGLDPQSRAGVTAIDLPDKDDLAAQFFDS